MDESDDEGKEAPPVRPFGEALDDLTDDLPLELTPATASRRRNV